MSVVDVAELGDYCESCLLAGDEHPIRFPHRLASDGRAEYRCRCGAEWLCSWHLPSVVAEP